MKYSISLSLYLSLSISISLCRGGMSDWSGFQFSTVFGVRSTKILTRNLHRIKENYATLTPTGSNRFGALSDDLMNPTKTPPHTPHELRSSPPIQTIETHDTDMQNVLSTLWPMSFNSVVHLFTNR